MKVRVNDANQEIAGATIGLLDLIKQNNVKEPAMVSVQVNGDLC